MNAVALRAALAMPWQQRCHGAGLRMAAALLVVLLALLTATSVWLELGLARWFGLAGLVVLVMFWYGAVEGLVRQNRPELARLLPGQLQVLRVLLLGQALAVSLAALGCLALLLELRLAWVWGVVATVVALAWLARDPWLWIAVSALSLVPALWPWLKRLPLQWALSGPMPWLAAAALLVLLMAVLGDGGAAHRRWAARRPRGSVQPALPLGNGTPAQAGRAALLRPLLRVFTWPLALRRRRLLARPTSANALQRLDLGLGTGGQGTMLLWLLALLAGTALAAVVLLVPWSAQLGPRQIIDAAALGLCTASFNAACAPLLGRPAALCSRGREQALLVLLPGLPTGAVLAARIEAHWRREHLALWAVVSAAVLAVASQGSPATLDFAAAYSAGALPLVWLSQWRHRRPAGGMSGMTLWMTAPSLLVVPAFAAQWLAMPPWASLGVCGLVYLACARFVPPPERPLLPVGRG